MRKEWIRKVCSIVWKDKLLYLLLLPVMANFFFFHYAPMYGVQIAFKRYNLVKGMAASPWIGFANFKKFFSSYYAWEYISNTIILNLLALALSPLPIVLALLLNEVRHDRFKKTVQTITYLPNFVSSVIVIGLVKILFSSDGIITNTVTALFGSAPAFLTAPNCFRPMYLGVCVWQSTGFESIIFIAAITAIDPTLYDAAEVDGAGRLRRIWHITLPGILPTIIILYIMRMGTMLGSSTEMILLLQNPLNTVVSETIQTFTYKRGLINSDFGYASAVGLFQSVISFFLVMISNFLASRASGGEHKLF